MKNKDVTLRICENIKYLGEQKGIIYIRSIESELGVSKGYLSRCIANDNKRISADTVKVASDYFKVSVDDLMNKDLRKEK